MSGVRRTSSTRPARRGSHRADPVGPGRLRPRRRGELIGALASREPRTADARSPGTEYDVAVRSRGARHRPVEAPHARLASSRASTLDARGCVVVDAETRRDRNPKVYAGGDCVNGGKEVVNAVADGRDAARAMMRAWRERRGGEAMADLSDRLRGHQEPEPVLARVGAPDEHRRAGHARVRRGLGRRRLEDARRPDRQRDEPLRRRSTTPASEMMGLNNIELITDRPLEVNLARCAR